MNVKEQIFTWLNSDRDYSVGIFLLKQTKVNPTLVRNLSKRQNRYNTEKLEFVLQREVEDYQPETLKKKKSAPQPDSPPIQIKVKAEVDTSDFEKKRNVIYGQRDYIHANLESAETDESRLEMCFEINRLQDKIEYYNRKIDAMKLGQSVNSEETDNALKKEKTLRNTRSSVSRYKRLLQTEVDPDKKAKYKAKLEHYTNLKNELENG